MSQAESTRVAVLMGSDSDLGVMAAAVKVLEKLGVGYEIHVTSAHRSPARTAEIVAAAPERGVRVFIVGAGAAAHLAGVVAAHTSLPVLGVPLAATSLGGLDALLSTVQMPAGIPVGTLAIGEAGAANAAWLAAEILALSDERLAATIARRRVEMSEAVAKKSERARSSLPSLLDG